MKKSLEVTEFRLKIYPKDFDKVRAFYERELKLPVIHEWNRNTLSRGVMFDVGGTILELLTRDERYSPVVGADLSIEVSDVWSLFDEIKEEDYVTRGLIDNAWGDTSFCITDPEGLKISLFTRHTNISE